MDYLQSAAPLDQTGFIDDLSLLTTAQLHGQPVKPIWLENIRKKIQHYPIGGSDISAQRLLLECQQSGRCRLPHDEVLELFRLAAGKGSLQAITLLAFYEANVMGHVEPARRAFEKAVRRSPKDPSYRVNFASFLAAVGDYDHARTELDIARQLDTFQVYKREIEATHARMPEGKSYTKPSQH